MELSICVIVWFGKKCMCVSYGIGHDGCSECVLMANDCHDLTRLADCEVTYLLIIDGQTSNHTAPMMILHP
jgi:hypothetical protein